VVPITIADVVSAWANSMTTTLGNDPLTMVKVLRALRSGISDLRR